MNVLSWDKVHFYDEGEEYTGYTFKIDGVQADLLDNDGYHYPIDAVDILHRKYLSNSESNYKDPVLGWDECDSLQVHVTFEEEKVTWQPYKIECDPLDICKENERNIPVEFIFDRKLYETNIKALKKDAIGELKMTHTIQVRS